MTRAAQRIAVGFDHDLHVASERDDLLAAVSHDLRNPLSAIDLAASMLEPHQVAPAAQRQVAIIRRASREIDQVIRDLVDLTNMHAGRFAVDKQLENATRLVSEVLDLHAPLATDRLVTLVRDVRVEGVQVSCDRARLVQVLSYLVESAIRFCRAGDSVTVRCEYDEWCMRIMIEDTGPGIAAEALPHVFDPHWTSKRHETKSAGIGLFISRGIIGAHGGTLEVASKPGATIFTIVLPLI